MLNVRQAQVIDPILTTLARGYVVPQTSLWNFVAPVVQVPTRTGKVIEFGKEAFAAGNYERAYGATIPSVSSRYSARDYTLKQDALAWELPMEIVNAAEAGPAQIRLRDIETRNVLARLDKSYEAEVMAALVNPSLYETDCVPAGLTSGAAWNQSTAKIINDVLSWKRRVADHIGIAPNSAIIGTAVADALASAPEIVDRIKYTTVEGVTESVLARYFGLDRGLKVAESRILNRATNKLVPAFPANGILLFYSSGDANTGIMGDVSYDQATPSFAYTYQLDSTPYVEEEYFVKERKVIRADVCIERKLELVGLGSTGKIGSALYTTVLA